MILTPLLQTVTPRSYDGVFTGTNPFFGFSCEHHIRPFLHLGNGLEWWGCNLRLRKIWLAADDPRIARSQVPATSPSHKQSLWDKTLLLETVSFSARLHNPYDRACLNASMHQYIYGVSGFKPPQMNLFML